MSRTIHTKELNALITLLEDPDCEVHEVVSSRIIGQGQTVIPMLEKAWESLPNEMAQRKIEALIHTIQFNDVKTSLSEWVKTAEGDLLKGACIIASYYYPSIDLKQIDDQIEALRSDVWVELNSSLTALEKVKTMNHIFFKLHGFAGSTANFFSPQNHYINQVIETKKGGPVALSIIYSVIAQRLNLPIHGVSLPRNFLLAYMDTEGAEAESPLQGPILFYINPFNNGTVLGRKEIEQYLTQNMIPAKNEFFRPCSNRVTLSQLIASLMLSYQKIDQPNRITELQELLDITTGM